MDIFRHIEQTHRELVSRRLPAGEGHAVVLRRTYPAAVADVWEACTDADRLSRWFLPVTGELRLGGHYQLEGNAGGEILYCEPPRLLKVTWIFGADPGEAAGTSEVELRLEALGPEETRLELVHAGIETPGRWAEFGPGATRRTGRPPPRSSSTAGAAPGHGRTHTGRPAAGRTRRRRRRGTPQSSTPGPSARRPSRGWDS
jgi:uncharacterized protein YndB with AHSA1/START domain